MGQYYQGVYQIKNLDKYIGDPVKCVFRSSWERTVMLRLDYSPSVLKWGAEPFNIKYINKYDNKIHRYWPDFIIVFKAPEGGQTVVVVEVKPKKETKPPVKRGKKKARYLQECKTWVTNQSKWLSAEKFCNDRGWHFAKMTETEIFGAIK